MEKIKYSAVTLFSYLVMITILIVNYNTANFRLLIYHIVILYVVFNALYKLYEIITEFIYLREQTQEKIDL